MEKNFLNSKFRCNGFMCLESGKPVSSLPYFRKVEYKKGRKFHLVIVVQLISLIIHVYLYQPNFKKS